MSEKFPEAVIEQSNEELTEQTLFEAEKNHDPIEDFIRKVNPDARTLADLSDEETESLFYLAVQTGNDKYLYYPKYRLGRNEIRLLQSMLEEKHALDEEMENEKNIRKLSFSELLDEGYSPLHAAHGLIYVGRIEEFLKNSSRFSEEENIKLYSEISKDKDPFKYLELLTKYPQMDRTIFALALLRDSYLSFLYDHADELPGLDHNRVVQEILNIANKEGASFGFGKLFKKVRGLNKNTADILLRDGYESLILDFPESFVLSKEEKRSLVGYGIDVGDIKFAADMNAVLGGNAHPALKLIVDRFDADKIDIVMYRDLEKLVDGEEIASELKELGVRNFGVNGLNELENKLKIIGREFLEGKPSFDLISNNHFCRAWFKEFVRFGESEWGDHSEKEFDRIINVSRDSERKPQYSPSGTFLVDKIDAEAQRELKYSEDFLMRYKVLGGAVAQARELVRNPRGLRTLAEEGNSKKRELLEQLDKKLSATTNPRAQEGLEKKIALLQSVDLNTVSDIPKLFEVLAEYKEFHDILRQAAFYSAFKTNRAERAREGWMLRENPSIETISQLVNFIDHITNQETVADFFKGNDAALKAFGRIVDTKALTAQLSAAQNVSKKGTMSLGFYPDTNILMEFSGHIGDACWASKYKSIVEKFPNFTSVTIAQDPEGKHIRLAGSFLLIETTLNDEPNGEYEGNEEVLLVRGLNPVENFINQISVHDFLKKTIGYLEKISQEKGRKLAIVIDDHSGGAATNRPVLYDYLRSLRPLLKKTPFLNPTDTEFNGYDRVHSEAYFISSEDVKERIYVTSSWSDGHLPFEDQYYDDNEDYDLY